MAKIYVADKDTLDSVKETAEATSEKVDGVQNTANAILSELQGQRPKRYGFRVKIAEPDPEARVEYIYDAVGMTPAAMNFSGGVFNVGSWADVWFVRDNYPAMVKYDGTEVTD